MTAFFPLLDTPTTKYTVQAGCGYLDPAYLAATKSQHPAEDFNAVTGSDTDLGDPVHAADDGTVTYTGWDSYIGGIVEIQHADGSVSGYWHLRDLHVSAGQRVSGGDMIGQVGKGAQLNMNAHLPLLREEARREAGAQLLAQHPRQEPDQLRGLYPGQLLRAQRVAESARREADTGRPAGPARHAQPRAGQRSGHDRPVGPATRQRRDHRRAHGHRAGLRQRSAPHPQRAHAAPEVGPPLTHKLDTAPPYSSTL